MVQFSLTNSVKIKTIAFFFSSVETSYKWYYDGDINMDSDSLDAVLVLSTSMA